jgi:mRNA interferase RelE/StbE
VAAYRLVIKPSAAKELGALGTRTDRRRIVALVRALGDEPRPRGCEKLAGRRQLLRARVGRFRVLYAIDDDERVVTVVKIGHRGSGYR